MLDGENADSSRAKTRLEPALARGNSNAEEHITSKCVSITVVLLESRINLKARFTVSVVVWGFLIAAALASPQRMDAQAAPGPIMRSPSHPQSADETPQPEAKPEAPKLPGRKTLAGPWKMNRDDSDDPRQKLRASEGSSGGNNGGNSGGRGNPGGYPGGNPGGYPGGGRGGWPGGGGGSPSGGSRNSGQDLEDNPKLQELVYPSQSLNIELKNPEIDVTDDQSHKLLLYTDGRKLQKFTDSNQQEVLAHWSGSELVSDEKSPLGGKMSRTFELADDGRKLHETLSIENGRSERPVIIRYVYDVAGSDVQSGEDSDPDRPVLKKRSEDVSSPQ
jgi:hypothetical protein